jgi:hypothetical protein
MLQNQYFFSIIKSLYYDTLPYCFGSKSNKSLTLPQENPRPGKSPIAISFINNVAHSSRYSLKPTVWSICITYFPHSLFVFYGINELQIIGFKSSDVYVVSFKVIITEVRI